MIKKLVFGMLLVMCVMGCAKKESSAALTLTPPEWAIGTWGNTNMGTTWTISASEIKYVFEGGEINYGGLATSQAVTETTYTITAPGDGGDANIVFTKVDATTIKINMSGSGDFTYTK
ncbi:MAG: hypothetical protein ISQ13_01255 [Candidatus Margulisbacteria bacterium]|nr:hypothetical protein [Candidatus Margulisiibacteriota bacterium]